MGVKIWSAGVVGLSRGRRHHPRHHRLMLPPRERLRRRCNRMPQPRQQSSRLRARGLVHGSVQPHRRRLARGSRWKFRPCCGEQVDHPILAECAYAPRAQQPTATQPAPCLEWLSKRSCFAFLDCPMLYKKSAILGRCDYSSSSYAVQHYL